MASIDILLSPRIFPPKSQIQARGLRSITVTHSKGRNFVRSFRPQPLFIDRRSLPVLCQSKSDASSRSGNAGKSVEEDFVTRVLKENPSQVEPRYLIGDKFFTLKEKQNLSKKPEVGLFRFLVKKLNLGEKSKNKSDEGQDERELKNEAVYLNDILRDYRGKLYVPEQVFGTELSEEEEFERSFDELPKMSLEDFQKSMENDKVKLLTSKEVNAMSFGNVFRDFIVDLKEIPGEKSLQRTKW